MKCCAWPRRMSIERASSRIARVMTPIAEAQRRRGAERLWGLALSFRLLRKLPTLCASAPLRLCDRSAIGCVLLSLILMVGCAARTVLDREETALVAWWVEDTCRGVPRTVAELRTEHPSQGLQRIADWAATRGAQGGLPPQLASRHARWPVVRAFLVEGLLVPAEDGLVTVPKSATGEQAAMARTVAKDENHDRLTGEVVVLSMARENEDGTRRLRTALRQTRTEADVRTSD